MTRRVLPIFGLLFVLLLSPSAFAQAGRDLPANFQSKQTFSAQDQEAIRQFVSPLLEQMAGANAAEISEARRRLTEPLRRQGASVAFRLEYEKALTTPLRQQIEQGGEVTAINAVLLAGELASPASAGLLRAGLSQDRPAPVRYAATQAYQRFFRLLQSPNTAVAAPVARGALMDLARGVADEQSLDVLDGALQALAAAAVTPTQSVAGLRSTAISESARLTSAIAAAGGRGDAPIDASLLAVVQRGLEGLRNALIFIGNNEPAPSAENHREAGRAAGEAFALVRRLAANPADLDDRSWAGVPALLQVAYVTYNRAHNGLSIGADTPVTFNPALPVLIESGRFQDYRRDVLRLIGSAGVLTGSPFNWPDDQFIKPGEE